MLRQRVTMRRRIINRMVLKANQQLQAELSQRAMQAAAAGVASVKRDQFPDYSPDSPIAAVLTAHCDSAEDDEDDDHDGDDDDDDDEDSAAYGHHRAASRASSHRDGGGGGSARDDLKVQALCKRMRHGSKQNLLQFSKQRPRVQWCMERTMEVEFDSLQSVQGFGLGMAADLAAQRAVEQQQEKYSSSHHAPAMVFGGGSDGSDGSDGGGGADGDSWADEWPRLRSGAVSD
jgi:uncharacterized membrane protein YgcG